MPETARLELLRQQRDGLVEKRARLRLIDRRQAAEIKLGEVLVRPLVRAAGRGMDGIGDELLAQAEHLQRMALDALERLHGAVDQQPLRRPPDAQRRRFAQPLAREFFEAMRQLGIIGNVDVDGGDGAADDADAGVGPAAPLRQLKLGGGARGVPGPIRIIAPAATTMAAGLLGAGLDRDDRIAVGEEARAVSIHEARHCAASWMLQRYAKLARGKNTVPPRSILSPS